MERSKTEGKVTMVTMVTMFWPILRDRQVPRRGLNQNGQHPKVVRQAPAKGLKHRHHRHFRHVFPEAHSAI